MRRSNDVEECAMDPYPDINDPEFQFKIAQMSEFRDLKNVDGLYPHQEFVRRFMSPFTPYRSLIMYHSLGSGKSIACIAVAVDHYLHDGKECIIVTKGDSGTENFRKQILMYKEMSKRKNQWNEDIFAMNHYISMSNHIHAMSDEAVIKAFSNKIIILDEVHNVKYLTTSSDRKNIENSVYGSIIRIVKSCANVKIIMATATPMTDNPDQIQSLLGICNQGRDDLKSMAGVISYNSVIRDKPDSMQKGTDEYVPGLKVYASHMVGHQRDMYASENKDKPPDDIYRKLTHISLFCFEDGICGKEVTDIIENGQREYSKKMFKTKHMATITSMSTNKTREIKYTKYSIRPEFAHELRGHDLRRSSSKYSAVMDTIEREGNAFVFLEEVKGSGLLLLAAVLEAHGYELYLGEHLDNIPPGRRYTMCVGSADICPNNTDRLEGFNSDANKNGEYVKILLGSKVIGESITLKNVRHFYCLTPHWNDSTVDQAIGRVVRNGSHLALEEEDRHVDIYIHASIFPDDPHSSVDIKKLIKCKEKEKNIQKVADKMIEIAVDRYCLKTSEVPITYVNNYAAAYAHNYLGDVVRYLGKAFEEHDVLYVHSLSEHMRLHPTVIKECLCRIIASNIGISSSWELLPLRYRSATPGCAKFLRSYEDYVFTVTDPSLPFVMMPPVQTTREYAVADTRETEVESEVSLATFRSMSVESKIAFIEKNIDHLDEAYDTAYARIDDIAYHVLYYRDKEKSYTSVNPVPKKPASKTRMYDGETWSFVTDVEEESRILEIYKGLINDVLARADSEFDIYGIISTIDGDMRLRLRDIEDKNKSSTDSRYVRRGRNMKSIRKELLIYIAHRLGIDAAASINEIVSSIDSAIVDMRRYIVL